MIVLAGASASGKTEVAKRLAKKYGIVKVITTTTRPIRHNEVNGRDYFFVSIEDFHKLVDEDKFVEYTVYNGNMYGSTKDQIQQNKCIVIDPIGLNSYIELDDETIVTFFLKSTEKTRYKRMIERGDSIENAKQRILNDKVAFKKEHLKNVNYKINSETKTIEEVCDEIYNLYMNHLKNL